MNRLGSVAKLEFGTQAKMEINTYYICPLTSNGLLLLGAYPVLDPQINLHFIPPIVLQESIF